MRFRIGVNRGDVIHDETRVYGDGVNVAARLESIAEPGGIYISGKVYDEITGKVTTAFQDLGLQQLKNIAQPVRVYRVQTGQAALTSAHARPVLALPDKPSIAVLPFANLSGDPKEDYFSDGITEDIITEVSCFSELFVLARNSSFQYKAKSPDIRQVGRELGVRYVLEGSIRRSGDRVRISAQLIDATTGAHRWAERYDRKLEDVFAVQDEVARMIVSIIAAHVNKAEVERTLLKPPAIWQTYDYFMRAAHIYASYLSSWKAEELYEARRLFECSISIDPNFARAYAELSRTYGTAWLNSVDKDFRSAAVLDSAVQLAHEALRLDPNLPQAHAQMGMLLTCKHQHEASIVEFEKAIALNTNYTDWRFIMALECAGDSARAIQVGEAHMRLDPFYLPVALLWVGFAYFSLRRYAGALLSARECVARAPNFRSAHCLLAATYTHLGGHKEEARAEVAEILRIEPKYTIGITLNDGAATAPSSCDPALRTLPGAACDIR